MRVISRLQNSAMYDTNTRLFILAGKMNQSGTQWAAFIHIFEKPHVHIRVIGNKLTNSAGFVKHA